jgi:hypothetical protein
VIELFTVDQAEDAAAVAMARLLEGALERQGPFFSVLPDLDTLTVACRELLRGPVVEAFGIDQPHLGGYCMKAPTDPTLAALGHLGAQLVEISYQVRNVPRALDEVDALLEEFRRVALVARS